MQFFWKLFLFYSICSVVLAAGIWATDVAAIHAWRAEREEQELQRMTLIARRIIRALGGVDASAELLREAPRNTGIQYALLEEGDSFPPLSSEDLADARQAAQRGQDWIGVRQEPGGPRLRFVISSLGGPDQSSILLCASAPAENWQIPWGTTATVFGFFALLLALATYSSYRIASRLNNFAKGFRKHAKATGKGKMVTPLTDFSRDEVGLLAKASNKLQRKVHRRVTLLKETNARLMTILSSMDEGVLAIDAQENLLLANYASRHLLEFVAVNGQPLLEVTCSQPLLDACRKVLSSETSCSSEFEVGSEVRRTLSLRATRLPGDPCPGVVLVLHDVTELRRLENLRRELVANVSHELKTPLASIKAYAETLRLGAVNDPENNLVFLGRIEEQADRLHQLILDLLQLARVESGQEVFNLTDVILDESIQDCVSHLVETAATRNIGLTLQPPESPLAVRADRDGLRTIIDNLIDNALKYTPEGGEVTVRWSAESEAFVLLEVEDNGIGIAPQDQTRIFERFYRVDKARSRELGGTGLGLSIVKHLVSAFGGRVKLKSAPEKGSTFQVRLPRALLPGQQIAAQTEELHAG